MTDTKPPTLSNTGMTAREIMDAPRDQLHGLAAQFRFIIQRYTEDPHRCPSCGLAQTIVEAAGHTLDTYPWAGNAPGPALRCRNPECARPLVHHLSLTGTSSFGIDHDRDGKDGR